jgi:hypothetical protein
LIVGRTGSGKTFMGLYILSEMPIDEMPWIIIDYKGDSSIAQIPFAHQISLGEIPVVPGVYIVRPLHTQDEEIDTFLMEVWRRENIGLYIDEGVMLAKSDALDTILIQGRSKNIPVIMLTQRPVGISRFAFSESQYFVIFPNHDKREQKTISEIAPLFQDRNSDDANLPQYHSHYYDVIQRKLERLSPVPPLKTIMKTFYRKLKPEDQINQQQRTPSPAPIQGVRYVEL